MKIRIFGGGRALKLEAFSLNDAENLTEELKSKGYRNASVARYDIGAAVYVQVDDKPGEMLKVMAIVNKFRNNSESIYVVRELG